MSSDAGPPRLSLPLPEVNAWPRVGKIRAGVQVPVIDKTTGKPKTRSGETVTRPAAIDHFRVDPEDGVTAPESAASFHDVYGEEPRTIRCLLPGHEIADVWEGAFRLYGTSKLKRRCNGETCAERLETGGWETKPCVCGPRRNTDADGVCKLGWTLNVLLPDVLGMGVWQVTTGSEISVRKISAFLQMMKLTMGSLLMVEFTLALTPEKVSPDGKTKTVYVLTPQAVSATPAQLLEGGGRRAVASIEAGHSPAMPAPADDEETRGPEGEQEPLEGDVIPPRRPEGELTKEENALWQSRLQSLIGLGLEPDLIADKVAEVIGRRADAWDLLIDEVFTEVGEWAQEQADARKPAAAEGPGDGRREPDDPEGPHEPIPGQESFES